MKVLHRMLRLVVLICIAALVAALPQIAIGLALAFLVPVWFFFTAVTSFAVPDVNERTDIWPFPSVPVFSPRPPPIN
jgi:uncharacterized membrane protein